MRVVIADDAVLVREGIAGLLVERGLEIAGQAGDVAELMELVQRQQPDVAVIDIRMPPTHTDEGLLAAHAIRTRYPNTAALVLSQVLNPGYAVRLIRDSPAHVGYLLKERVGHVDELVDAITRVAAGECVVDPSVVAELVGRPRVRDPLRGLSEREREILGLMAEGRSNQGICEKLWLSPKTIETHIRNVFSKLGLQEMPQDNRRVLAVLAFLQTGTAALPPTTG